MDSSKEPEKKHFNPDSKLSMQSKNSLPQNKYNKNVNKESSLESMQKIRTIKVRLENCENIKPFFPVADIQANCEFCDAVIGTSTPVPITDSNCIKVDYVFEIQMDVTSTKDLDSFVSSPAFLIFNQIQGTLDRHIYPQLQLNEQIHLLPNSSSFDSIVSLYEALDPANVFTTPSALKKKPSKLAAAKQGGLSKSSLLKDKEKMRSKISIEKKSTTQSVRSKSSASVKKASRYSKQSLISGPSIVYEPTLFGMCTLDFLPLIYGQKSFTQCLPIQPIIEYKDERMNSFQAQPNAVVTIWTEDDLEIKNMTILNFTVESIYNIPSMMTPDLEYKICTVLPMLNGQKMPLLFSNPVTLFETTGRITKCWPGIQRIGTDTNTTQYRTPGDYKDINAKFDDSIDSYIKLKSPRLQFVMIKRHLLLRDAVDEIACHVKIYRKIVVEFLMCNKQPKRNSVMATGKNAEQSAKKGTPAVDQTAKKTSPLKQGPYLHCMAILDVSTLLYPGVTRVRAAAPLMTFNFEEASKYGGLEDSYFFPGMHKDTLPKENGKPEKGEKSDKSHKDKSGGDDQNLKYKLPLRPEEAVEPFQVYDEEGHPCFIICEIELTNSLIPKKDIEDLTGDLAQLLNPEHKIVEIPQSKIILSSCITLDYYKTVLNAMISDLNDKYLLFKEENIKIEDPAQEMDYFVEFLKRAGIYESYVNSISNVVSMIVNKKFCFNNQNDELQYQKLVGDIFVYLVSKMNETVNKLVCHGMEPKSDLKNVDNNLFFAKEAMETGRKDMAERYLLERICNDSQNPDYWFHYALFLLQNREDDKAFECIKETLKLDMNHKYGLLSLGILLNNKNEKEDAENCFLKLMDAEFDWTEGWAVLYLFYLRHDNLEGMEMAIEMAKKYIAMSEYDKGDLISGDELAWTKDICPNTIYFRTAVLLVRLRLFEWAELALSQEVNSNPGLVHYLLSAVCYYKKMYTHAIEHIEEAKIIYGTDYAVASLTGHNLLALGRKEEAKQQFYYAVEAFNRPVSMHLAHVQLANILGEFGDDQEARKVVLVACKYNPTPYTWLLAGIFYYRENDLLSAEECFSEGNSIDNRYAEIWGYLALVNAKLKRANEAELCFHQALKNKLQDENLIDAIKTEISSFSKQDLVHVY